MKFLIRLGIVLCLQGMAVAAQQTWPVPTRMKKLPNGLVVVVSEDHSAPDFRPLHFLRHWFPSRT